MLVVQVFKGNNNREKKTFGNLIAFFLTGLCMVIFSWSVSLPTCYSVLFPDVSSFLVVMGGNQDGEGGGGERKKEVLHIVAHTSPSLLL